ncbi:MAG: hypothetical protein J0L77_08550 [Alphaproteobacteria bacterium]|nr:hypothetical protein [Alphaproteobacteria bacterium]
MSWKRNLFITVGTLLGVVFLPTTIILAVGMLPTGAALLIDKTRGKVRTLTIGSMNLAGCVPFILELWMRGHTFDNAMGYLMEPRTIVVMYFAAAIGYMIDWAMTGIVIGIMSEKGKARVKQIEKEKQALITRWGEEVTNTLPLDEDGFPIVSVETDKTAS